MKAIMKSIRPQHDCNILNLIKELEISTTAPKEWKDYLSGKTDKKPKPIDVYIYCTKDKDYDLFVENGKYQVYFRHNRKLHSKRLGQKPLNGKVVAKFTLNEVERLYEYQVDGYGSGYKIASDTLKQEELLKKCCLTYEQLGEYLGDINNGYAWHIDNLVVFDKPKDISEFETRHWNSKNPFERDNVYELTRAPQSWYYIEV